MKMGIRLIVLLMILLLLICVYISIILFLEKYYKTNNEFNSKIFNMQEIADKIATIFVKGEEIPEYEGYEIKTVYIDTDINNKKVEVLIKNIKTGVSVRGTYPTNEISSHKIIINKNDISYTVFNNELGSRELLVTLLMLVLTYTLLKGANQKLKEFEKTRFTIDLN